MVVEPQTETTKLQLYHLKRNRKRKRRRVKKRKGNRRKAPESDVLSTGRLCSMSSRISWFRMDLVKLAFCEQYARWHLSNMVTITASSAIFFTFYSREFGSQVYEKNPLTSARQEILWEKWEGKTFPIRMQTQCQYWIAKTDNCAQQTRWIVGFSYSSMDSVFTTL